MLNERKANCMVIKTIQLISRYSIRRMNKGLASILPPLIMSSISQSQIKIKKIANVLLSFRALVFGQFFVKFWIVSVWVNSWFITLFIAFWWRRLLRIARITLKMWPTLYIFLPKCAANSSPEASCWISWNICIGAIIARIVVKIRPEQADFQIFVLYLLIIFFKCCFFNF